eukprot:TRINITY_DN2747_c0_g1_i3.p1 TRINITY_DN2747_c0_g1~~TRINITY_DN2747_c0_g1_i3.p1  ORF type:complete len:430 (+),score=121.31 TRINITY_DN2747_c0_g1_i3:453-1742(+)
MYQKQLKRQQEIHQQQMDRVGKRLSELEANIGELRHNTRLESMEKAMSELHQVVADQGRQHQLQAELNVQHFSDLRKSIGEIHLGSPNMGGLRNVGPGRLMSKADGTEDAASNASTATSQMDIGRLLAAEREARAAAFAELSGRFTQEIRDALKGPEQRHADLKDATELAQQAADKKSAKIASQMSEVWDVFENRMQEVTERVERLELLYVPPSPSPGFKNLGSTGGGCADIGAALRSLAGAGPRTPSTSGRDPGGGAFASLLGDDTRSTASSRADRASLAGSMKSKTASEALSGALQRELQASDRRPWSSRLSDDGASSVCSSSRMHARSMVSPSMRRATPEFKRRDPSFGWAGATGSVQRETSAPPLGSHNGIKKSPSAKEIQAAHLQLQDEYRRLTEQCGQVLDSSDKAAATRENSIARGADTSEA